MGGDFSKKPTFHQHENTRITCSTYPGCILSNSVQDRLNIRRRTGDNTQNFTRGCLLFQRLLEFLEKPHILDGDHGLISESLDQLDLRGCEGTHFGATCRQRSDDFCLLTQRNHQERTRAAEDTQVWEFILRESVRDMQRAMLDYPAKSWFINTDLLVRKTDSDRTEPRPRNEIVPVAKSQSQIIDSTDLSGAFDNSIEHRLNIGGRSADNPEHLGRCRLMLQGFTQFCVALLKLFEQPHILDGDHRLVRESFEKCDLLVGEGSNL